MCKCICAYRWAGWNFVFRRDCLNDCRQCLCADVYYNDEHCWMGNCLHSNRVPDEEEDEEVEEEDEEEEHSGGGLAKGGSDRPERPNDRLDKPDDHLEKPSNGNSPGGGTNYKYYAGEDDEDHGYDYY